MHPDSGVSQRQYSIPSYHWLGSHSYFEDLLKPSDMGDKGWAHSPALFSLFCCGSLPFANQSCRYSWDWRPSSVDFRSYSSYPIFLGSFSPSNPLLLAEGCRLSPSPQHSSCIYAWASKRHHPSSRRAKDWIGILKTNSCIAKARSGCLISLSNYLLWWFLPTGLPWALNHLRP